MSGHLPKRPNDRQGFKIGIICALGLEAEAVELAFDKRYKKDGIKYGKAFNDSNTYTPGVIAGHNVVLAYCPSMGSNSAAQVARGLLSSFTNVKIVFVVGVCGAVPFYTYRGEQRKQIMLGDCLISTRVIQFDLGRRGPNGFKKKDGLDGLGRASSDIRSLMAMLQTSLNKQDLTERLLTNLQALHEAGSEVKYPGSDQDRLYKSSYPHTHPEVSETCKKCDVVLGICDQTCQDLGCADSELDRERSEENVAPSIHFGYLGSSNTVLKSALERDELAKTDQIIGFEMEGAGTWDVCSTIVIKAACDYADSHKNKKWQAYAATVAAAGLKALLLEIEFPDEMVLSKDDTNTPLDNKLTHPNNYNNTFNNRTNHVFQGSTVYGGIHHYDSQPTTISQRNDFDGTKIHEAISEVDIAIKEYYQLGERLKIERLSGETLSLENCYINLALTDISNEKQSKIEELPLTLDERLNLKADSIGHPVALSELFAPRKLSNGATIEARRIFIQGRAGIGKSTLCKKIVHEFLQHRLGDQLFDRLLWLPLRRLSNTSPKYTWVELLQDMFSPAPQIQKWGWDDVAKVMAKQFASPDYRSRTLFLLDGLDEVSSEWSPENGVYKFLESLVCDMPNVILTSRPQVGSSLKIGTYDIKLETTGFTLEQIDAYIGNCVKDGQTVSRMKNLLATKPLLQGLLRIPVQLDAFCCTFDLEDDSMEHRTDEEHLLKDAEGDSISTMTTLYIAISDELCKKDLVRIRKHNQPQQLRMLAVRDLLAEELRFLEEFAFQGLINSVIDFSYRHQESIDRHFRQSGTTLPISYISTLEQLSFLRTSDVQLHQSRKRYHFLHLTYQEFFAAKHFVRHWQYNTDLTRLDLSSASDKETISPVKFLQIEKYNPRFNIFWRFVTGLLQIQPEQRKSTDKQKLPSNCRNILSFFNELNNQPIDLLGAAHHRLLMYCLSEVASSRNEEIQDLCTREEDSLRRWTITELELFEEIILGREAEFPEKILCSLLQNENDLPHINTLEALTARPLLSVKTLCAVSNCMRNGFAMKIKLLAIRVIFRNSRPDSQELTAQAVDFFSRMLKDEHQNVRLEAIKSIELERSLSTEVNSVLIASLKDGDSGVRECAAWILGRQLSLSTEAIDTLVTTLKDENSHVQGQAARVLRGRSSLSIEAIDALIAAIKDEDSNVRRYATGVLRGQSSLSIEAINALITALKDKDSDVRREAAMTLKGQSSPEAINALITALKDKDSSVRLEAAIALEGQSPLEAINALITALKDKDSSVRLEATIALGGQSSLEIFNALIAALKDEDSHVRREAAIALGGRSSLSTEAINALIVALKDEDYHVREYAATALRGQSSLSAEVINTMITILEDRDDKDQDDPIYEILSHNRLFYSTIKSLKDKTWRQLWSYWLRKGSFCCYELEGCLYVLSDGVLHPISTDLSRTQELLEVVLPTKIWRPRDIARKDLSLVNKSANVEPARKRMKIGVV